jgi:hypothetical protein
MVCGMMTLAVVAGILFAPATLSAQDRGYPDRDDRGRDARDRGSPDYGDPGNGYVAGGQQIRCESWQYQPARCPIGGRGRAQLIQVIAGNCIEGQTWGSDRGGVWVNGGCRATFASFGGGYPGTGGGYPGAGGGYAGGQPIDVTCQSWQYQPSSCPIGVARRADIVQLLGGDCVRGRTWGMNRGAIWVNGGCRARFRAY